MIFELVVGRNLLHIIPLSGRMGHVICSDECSRTVSREQLWHTGCDIRAKQRSSIMAGDPPAGCPSSWMGNYLALKSTLSLLRACKQIYAEAIDLLYSSNTFDFFHPETFLWFSRTIHQDQLATVTSLKVTWFPKHDFRPFWSPGAYQLWWAMFSLIAERMTSLRKLEVLLYDRDMSSRIHQDRLLLPLSKLRGLQTLHIEAKDVTGFDRGGHIDAQLSPMVKEIIKQASQPRD